MKIPQLLGGPTSADFTRLRDSLTSGILNFEPEELRMLGHPGAAGQLKDWSPRSIAEEVEFCRDGLKKLNAIQVSRPADVLDRAVLVAHLTYLEHYYGQYHGELGNIHISAYPYDVIQYELQRLATDQPDSAPARPASAIDHFSAIEGSLRGLPIYLEQQQSNLTAGLKLRPPDKEALENMIKRIGEEIGPSSGDDNIRAGLSKLAERLESVEFQPLLPAYHRGALRDLIRRADAAYDRHVRFLKNELGRHACDSWPLGKDEYARRLDLIYGYRDSLDDLVRPAEEDLRRVKEEMISLAHDLRPDLPQDETLHLVVLRALRQRHPATEQELLIAYEQVQKKIDDDITSRLGLPAGAARYRSAPPGVEVSPATNWPAPLLSQGAAIVLLDASPEGLKENAIVDLPWIAGHEGNPGHAAQSLLFQSAFNKGSAPLCRFLNVPDEVGYVRGNWYAMANIEGWAFYTERLLLASGLLTGEERLAALTGQALRAARVVVDVRMHTAGWSRERAADYLMREAGQTLKTAHREASRYSRIPLQALSYYLGALQFEELYEKYAVGFGEKFYWQLLSLGPVRPELIGDYLESLTPLTESFEL